MRETHVMHDLEINNNEVSDLKALFSVLKTRKTKIFVYGFILAFMACTAFLAFNPSGNASPWINNLFTSSSSSSTFPYRSQFSSFFSYIFPNSSGSSVTVDVEQKNGILVKDQTVLDGLKVENQTGSGVPVKNLGKESVGNKKDGNLDGRNRSGSGVPVKCTLGCNITVSMKKGNGKKEARVGSTESVLLGGDMAVNFTVSMKKGNGNIVNQKEDWIKSLIGCDVFQGRWVKDESYPLYTEGSCPHIDEPFNCFLNGRLDKAYQNLRWQPNGCNIPRLNASDMLERLRGKRLVFVGDSLNRNMWESLVCVLRNSVKDKRKVFEMSGRREFRTEGSYSFLFKDYGCTIEFFRSPFLVQEWEMPDNSGHMKETLRLDKIESSSSKYKDAHVIIFNTGHWWTHEKTSKGKDYYQEGNHVYGELNVVEAFHRALKTWAIWVDANVNPNKTLVFFRGYSASHFRGGQWNSGGACDEETEPIKNETYLSSYPSKMSVLETVLNGMKTPVSYLNITRMTDYRKDAHPSVYRKQNLTEEEKRSPEKYQDCSHWCLPGVPDSWNELLYSQLLIKQYQQH